MDKLKIIIILLIIAILAAFGIIARFIFAEQQIPIIEIIVEVIIAVLAIIDIYLVFKMNK